MEPITVSIVTALSAGAAAAAKDVATSAVKDAYAALKRALVARFDKAAPFVEAVEANPSSPAEQRVLANQLVKVQADDELKRLTETLLQAVETLRADPRAAGVIDVRKLTAAQKFELTDIEFEGTLLHADEAVFNGDVRVSNLRQRGAAPLEKN